MLKHNMIGLRTHQSCNQDVNQVLSEQGDIVQAQSPARGSRYSVMMHQIQMLFSGDLRALACYFRDWDSLPGQSRWRAKGNGKGFCLSASVFLVSIHPTNAPHLITYYPGDEQWSCWRPKFHRMQSHSNTRIKVSEGFKERKWCEMKKKIVWKIEGWGFGKKMHRLHYKMCHNQVPLLNSVTDTEDGFGGLVVSILATGTRVRGFKPGRSRWIFRASGKSSVCLPSEGK